MPSREPAPGDVPQARRRPSGPLLFMLTISGVVIGFAVLVAVWMYWLGGVAPG